MRTTVAIFASLAVSLAACGKKVADPPVAEPAVHDLSALGSTFRAQGNEPGWMAEVNLSDPPSMRAEVDYGNLKYEIATVIEDTGGWRGTAADGTPVALRIERVECQDDMSGERFEAKAVLSAGGKDYRGCGRFRRH
jgi:uncharacterized membrane protein